ncbi:MAG TPA: hypothetical protein VHB97_05765, partial [Polyangia bacterium]|nr:hypothetical protein [Polyangia bacterium]
MSQSRNPDDYDSADEQKFRDALAFIDCVTTLNPTARTALDRIPLSRRTTAFLAEYEVPPWLSAFLARHSYRGRLSIGQASFDSIDKLSHSDDGDFEVTCLRDGLLPLGCGPNGDLIVVDMRSGCTGFVAMSELAQATEAAEAGELTEPSRSVLVLSPFRIGAFYLAAGQHAHDPHIYERFFPTRSREIDEQKCWARFVAEPGAPLGTTATRATVPLAPATEAFFAASGVDSALRTFLAAHAYPGDVDFAGYRLYAVNELPARQA